MHRTTEIKKPQGDLNQRQKTVMVVEDDRSHRTLIDEILRSCNFKTVQAETGYVALSKIDAGEEFDLILMDWDMPGLNGLETTKAIRVREVQDASPHKAIIAFTARRDPETRERCLAAGMDGYLPKDVFLPKWRSKLVDNLQGLVSGHMDLQDFRDEENTGSGNMPLDLSAFDETIFEQTKNLLKDEMGIAVEEYIEDARAYIQDIELGIKDGDIDKVGRGSHPLKSNSKGFGLIAVSQIAERINALSDDGANALPEIEKSFSQLLEAFEIGEKRIQQEL